MNAFRALMGIALLTAASLAVTPLAAAEAPTVPGCGLPTDGPGGAAPCAPGATETTWAEYLGTIGKDVGQLIDDLA